MSRSTFGRGRRAAAVAVLLHLGLATAAVAPAWAEDAVPGVTTNLVPDEIETSDLESGQLEARPVVDPTVEISPGDVPLGGVPGVTQTVDDTVPDAPPPDIAPDSSDVKVAAPGGSTEDAVSDIADAAPDAGAVVVGDELADEAEVPDLGVPHPPSPPDGDVAGTTPAERVGVVGPPPTDAVAADIPLVTDLLDTMAGADVVDVSVSPVSPTAIDVPGSLPTFRANVLPIPSLSYRCGLATGAGLVGQPAVVGACLFETAGTATTSGTTQVLTLDVIATPLAVFSNQVVAVGYNQYNIGVRLDGSAGSPFHMKISVTLGTNGASVCSASAYGTFETLGAGLSKIRSLEGSVGGGVLSSSDPKAISAEFSAPTAGPKTASMTFTGMCAGNKAISLALPAGLYALVGRYDAIKFWLYGVPTSASMTIETTPTTTRASLSHNASSISGTIMLGSWGTANLSGIAQSTTFRVHKPATTTTQATLTHNSRNLSGTIDLGSWGAINITNAHRYYDLVVTKDNVGDLNTLQMVANNAPACTFGAVVPDGSPSIDGTGCTTGLAYQGTVQGLSLGVGVSKISSFTLTANMPQRRVTGDLNFYQRQGVINSLLQGTWKGNPYQVGLNGTGLGHVFLGLSASSAPNIDFRARLRQCSPCGSIALTVRAQFFGVNLHAQFLIQRRTDGKYLLSPPWPFANAVVYENQGAYWLFGRIFMGAM